MKKEIPVIKPLEPAVSDRAETAIKRHWPDVQVIELRSLTGHSGLTVLARLKGGPVPDRIILKLCPSGRAPVGRHDVVRQSTIMQMLGQRVSVPVPKVEFIDEVMEPLIAVAWVEGEAIEPILELTSGSRSPDWIDARAREAARSLAALHDIPLAELGDPATLGPPTTASDELERWDRTMSTVDPTLRRGSQELHDLLGASVPPSAPARLIHGDFRLGNVLCQGAHVRAIIDWEIWSICDPRVDLGWFLVFADPSNLPGISVPIDGMPSPTDLLREYQTAASAPVPDLQWFDAFTRFKMAAIMGNNLKRHRSGQRVDPYQERLIQTIPSLVRQGLALCG